MASSDMLRRQVEAAQKRVEGNNYDTRKQVLQYDDVMREQREIIYAQRYDVITADRDLAPEIQAMIKRTIGRVVDGHARAKQDEKLEAILNFAKYNLLPEDSITLEDLSGLSDKAIKAAATRLCTVPTPMGLAVHVRLLEYYAEAGAPDDGGIPDANAPMIDALCREYGFEVVAFVRTNDVPGILRSDL